MWGKKPHHLTCTCQLDALVKEAQAKHGKDVRIHAVIYWSGNELVGEEGIGDEPRWPHRPPKLDAGSVYDLMWKRLERLKITADRCAQFVLVTIGPKATFTTSPLAGTNCSFISGVGVRNSRCKPSTQLRSRSTLSGPIITIGTSLSFFVSFFHVVEVERKFKNYEPVIDPMTRRNLTIYDEAIELEPDSDWEPKSGILFLAVKRRVLSSLRV